MSAGPGRIDCDVAIVGGGLVGASLAIALGSTPLRVALIEGTPPDAEGGQPSFDDRTTALGNATRRIFESIGVWGAIAPAAAAIRRIHVSDAGRFGFARLDAAEQGIDAFGYVATNRVLGRALHARLGELPNVRRLMPARASAIRLEESGAVIEVSGAGAASLPPDSIVHARLAVAADGAHSQVRAAAGLGAEIEDYEQVAVVAHVEAARRQDGTAYERFTPTGPLAALPLAGGGYGIVWTLEPKAAEEALHWPDAEFLERLQRCFGWRIGRFNRVGRRASYPLRLSRATGLVATRSVLIGNAAQSLHPVAGQGFNLGLRDAATLAEVLATAVAADAGADVGAPAVLEAFARARAADRAGVTRFTDGLVKLFGDDRAGVPLLRNAGLLAFDLLPPAKAALSRVSWGFGGSTPRLARGLGLGE
jgi:2-octaprenyl-6-methoxyphenol hydroxylase